MCGYPVDPDVVVSGHNPSCHLDDSSGPLLSRSQRVVQGPSNGFLGVRKDGIPSPLLSPGLQDPHRLVDHEKLGIEDLLVAAEEEASSSPSIASLPILECM